MCVKVGVVNPSAAPEEEVQGGFCPQCGAALSNEWCTACSPAPAGSAAGSAKKLPFLTNSKVVVGVSGLVLAAIIVVLTVALWREHQGSLPVTAGGLGNVSVTQGSGYSTTTTSSRPSPASTGPTRITMGSDSKLYTASTGAPFTEVWSGHLETSCPFSDNVAAAYRAAGPSSTTVVHLVVHSPVTNLDYDTSCEPTIPVRCTTPTGAIVYVVR